MKNLIAVCESHDAAVATVSMLKEKGFTSKQLSIIGRVQQAAGEEVPAGDDQRTEKMMNIAGTETGIGVTLGSALGILTGIGVFAIPGLGFLYGAGALVGAIAGFDLGLIGGGIVSALTIAGVDIDDNHRYDEQLKAGKFLVIVQGNADETKVAEGVCRSVAGISEAEVQ